MVKLGIGRLAELESLFKGKRIGLMTNNTGVSGDNQSTVDLLHKHYNLVKLFAPEHGVRGNLQAGVKLDGYADERTGLPVVSLYGASRHPDAEAVADIDIFAIDIQDAGSRFYTFLYSMAYIMQACAKYGKKCVVFDRPNPLACTKIEGNLLDESCKSFIGLYPIPQRYGITIGECALLFNSEFGISCDLEVVAMENYNRKMYFEETGLSWILPSPNLPTVESCFAFNATCIFEGTNISEGRGTTKPFQFVGAPWIDGAALADKLNSHDLPGVVFRPHYFTPLNYHPRDGKHVGDLCGGVEMHITDRETFTPVMTGITMLYTIKDISGFKFLPPYHEKGKHMLDYNTGNTYVREGIYTLDEIREIYATDSKIFGETAKKYHLYR